MARNSGPPSCLLRRSEAKTGRITEDTKLGEIFRNNTTWVACFPQAMTVGVELETGARMRANNIIANAHISEREELRVLREQRIVDMTTSTRAPP